MGAVVAYLTMGLGLLPKLIDAGMNVKGMIDRMRGVAEAKVVTDADWDDLHSWEARLRSNRPERKA